MISGPGGVGKGTLVSQLLARNPALWLSRSWTTRSQRPSEPTDAYCFVSKAAFEQKIAEDGFFEYAEFLGNWYGTPWPDVPEGTDVLLEIDVQGAAQVVAKHRNTLLVFLLPPSRDEQLRRLLGRGENEAKATKRVEVAEEERQLARSLHAVEVLNSDLDAAVAEVEVHIEQARESHTRHK